MKRNKAYAFINAIKNLRQTMSNEMALENIEIFPSWEEEKQLSISERIEYNGKLYKVLQSHIAQSSWLPDLTPTLFEPIDIVNDGSLEKPFIAVSGMRYYKDKYYFDKTDNKIYLCIRDDTGNGTQLYYMPSDLVGAYFTAVL